MTRDRLLLIGEDFGNSQPRYHNDVYALTGKSGKRLASLMGFAGETAMFQYALATERTNVVTLQPEWRDQALVAQRVVEIAERMRGRRVILLGVRVAAAFGVTDLDLMRWRSDHDLDATVARFPHPSGRSHWWNDAANVVAATRFLQDALLDR